MELKCHFTSFHIFLSPCWSKPSFVLPTQCNITWWDVPSMWILLQKGWCHGNARRWLQSKPFTKNLSKEAKDCGWWRRTSHFNQTAQKKSAIKHHKCSGGEYNFLAIYSAASNFWNKHHPFRTFCAALQMSLRHSLVIFLQVSAVGEVTISDTANKICCIVLTQALIDSVLPFLKSCPSKQSIKAERNALDFT